MKETADLKTKEKSIGKTAVYSSIFNNSHTPMLIIDSKSGEIRDVNLVACSFYGYSIEAFRKLNISDINILSRQKILEKMAAAKRVGSVYYNFIHRLSTGELREVEVYSGPIIINGEELLLSIVHDIQYKKDMEQKFQIQQSYFKGLFENSPEGVAILDNEFRIININESFTRIFQFTLDEIRNQNVTKVICEEKFYDESTYFKDSVKRGEFVRKEIQRARKDGKLLDISFLAYPIISDGEQIGVYAIYADLTKAKEEKREQDKTIQLYIKVLRSTIDSMPHTVAIYKPDFTIVHLNEAGRRFFEVHNESVEGISWCNLVKGKFNNAECYGDIVLRTKEVYLTEKWVQETDKYYDWQCVPIFNVEGETILIMERIKDITINKLYEKALRESKERAEEASKFKTKFIASVAHEIRTPMNGIVGIVDLLDDTQLTNKQKEYFNMLRYSAERLSIIINDVLDIAKIESGKLEIRNRIFSISHLLNDIEKYFRIQAETKNLKLSFFLDSAIPDALYGDADKLNQVLFNLLSNAIKFTAQGQICISAEAASKRQELVLIKFSIDDTGIGIPQQQTGKIFDDFFQMDSASTREYGGSGLGLPISKKLVELMGGNIAVESEYGRGSSFSFEISFKTVEQNERKEGSLDNINENPSKILPALNILVVEDENINQQIIKSFLERENCTVITAANGKEALNIISRQCFDIILMDIYMPEIDGFELAKIIRESENYNDSYTPIIAMTAATTKEATKENAESGIDSFIAKPFTKQQLCKAIADTLDKLHKKDAYDLRPILNILEGNQQLLIDIINEIASTEYQEEFLGKIERYAAEGDFENLSKQIHKFRGSISHFQIKPLNDVLSELRECCKKQEYSLIYSSIDKLKYEYENLKSYLMEYDKNKRL